MLISLYIIHNWVKCRIIIEKQIKGVIFADSIVK